MKVLRTIVHTRRITKKVGFSIIPVTLYNVGIQHHSLNAHEILQNAIDGGMIECISIGLQSGLHHFDNHKVPLQKIIRLDECFSKHLHQK